MFRIVVVGISFCFLNFSYNYNYNYDYMIDLMMDNDYVIVHVDNDYHNDHHIIFIKIIVLDETINIIIVIE